MAFPTIAATNSNQENVNQTVHTVNLPAGISNGDLLIVGFCLDGDGGAMTWPAGWTELYNVLGPSSVPNLQARFRRADGTEGATITVTSTNSEKSASVSYRITGHHTVTDPESATAGGTTANPDPPVLNPAGWGTEDTLWIVLYGWDGGRINDAYPASYTLSQVTDRNNAADGCGLAIAGQNINAASENPGTGTINTSDQWVASTLAIRPAAGGGIVLLDGTAAAVSSLTGALPVDKALGGTVPAIAALSGDTQVSRLMVSTVVAVSSLAGALPVEKGLAATIPATSALSGALALEWALAGIVPAISTLAGDLTVPGEIVLSGVIPVTSSLAGVLPVERLMTSTVPAISALEAILGKYRAIDGSIDAVSTLTGDLQRLRGLAGAIAGGSTLAGTLKLEWALRGVLAGTSVVSGDLTGALGFPWTRERLLTAKDISGPALRAPHRKEIE